MLNYVPLILYVPALENVGENGDSSTFSCAREWRFWHTKNVPISYKSWHIIICQDFLAFSLLGIYGILMCQNRIYGYSIPFTH
jgi:hypothetical protein